MPETLKVELRAGDFLAEVVRGGEGPPLVYLHGAIGQKGWAPFLDRLARDFTVYAPYLPGYADSTGLEHLDDLTDLTLYHFELLDALGLSRVHLAGHFLGGMIAAEMAALSPSYVNRLVLAAPAGLWNDAEPVADLIAMSVEELRDGLWPTPPGPMGLSPADSESQARVRDTLAADRMQDLAAAGKFILPLPDRGLKRRAYRIGAPTLIAWGEQDRINPPSYAPEFQRLIAGSRISMLPNAGHLLMLEQAGLFAETVAAFLTAG